MQDTFTRIVGHVKGDPGSLVFQELVQNVFLITATDNRSGRKAVTFQFLPSSATGQRDYASPKGGLVPTSWALHALVMRL